VPKPAANVRYVELGFNLVDVNGAKTLLSGAGADIQRQSSLVQQTMQDPNHDGLLGTAADNLLVPGLVRDLFSAATPSLLPRGKPSRHAPHGKRHL
jgi:hypothetical protein